MTPKISSFPSSTSRSSSSPLHTSELKYIGFVDMCSKSRISGWGIKLVGNEVSPIDVLVNVGKTTYRVPAKGFRQDLHEKAGIGFGQFSLDLPLSADSEPTITFEDGTPIPATPKPRQLIKSAIDSDCDAFFSGWATSSESPAPLIQLFCNGKQVAESYASRFRQDLADAGLNKGFAAFRCRIPSNFRGKQNVETRIEADGVEIYSAVKSYSPLSVLIVSETERLEDASRYYRCDNLRHLLQAERIDAIVIGPGEFSSKVWSHVDVIVFARFGVDAVMFEKVKQYKDDFDIKIVYEIDDLVFLPWHTSDLGSVRSGLDRADDPKLINMFARRLRLLMLADGAITTTPKISAHLAALGIPCKLIPNMVRPHELTHRIPRADGVLRILCMAGSPTHFRDFQDIEPILVKFLRRHGKAVELTLLGHFREGQQILQMPNVKHVQRVPYPQMLQIIDKSDLCIVPLEFTEFNDAKSCLKFIECGARGVPVLASATADYRRAITDEVNGLIAEDVDDWSRQLAHCIDGKYNLHEIGLAAQKVVFENFNLEKANLNLAKFVNGI